MALTISINNYYKKTMINIDLLYTLASLSRYKVCYRKTPNSFSSVHSFLFKLIIFESCLLLHLYRA